MALNLLELQQEIYARFLETQNLSRFLMNPTFERAYGLANDMERVEVICLIYSTDKEKVELWAEKIIKKYESFEEYTVSELRRLARSLGVSQYRYLTKDQLLSAISIRKQRNRNNGQGSYEGSNCLLIQQNVQVDVRSGSH